MFDTELKNEVWKLALQNAVKYNGKAQAKIILNRFLSLRLNLRYKIDEVNYEINKIVNEVNDLDKCQQENELKKYKIEGNIQKHHTQLPILKNAKKGKVVTRFAPEPNGYLHIGHAKAVIINEEYSKMYNGKIILRIDDTNPLNEKLEYYQHIIEDLNWLGIKFSNIKNSSEDIELMYDKCVKLIESNSAYICTCKKEIVQNNRHNKKPCKCRNNNEDQNNSKWVMMHNKYKSEEAIVRFRGDMESNNTVMRDPVLFRIINTSHPTLKTKYKVWPSYDFSTSIEDSIDGITHAFRSKEYELRNELYYKILHSLKMRSPEVLEFSRLELKGIPVSKRKIKSLIDGKKISGYDDPRLSTLRSMKRRGMLPIAIRKFIISLGFTKSNTLAPFDVLESINRKNIDPMSIRLHMIKSKKKMIIKNIPFKMIEHLNYPNKSEKRTIKIHEVFYVEKEDITNLKPESKIWLINLGNIKIKKIEPNCIYGEFTNSEIDYKIKKIQWVAENDMHKLKILIPKEIFIKDKFNPKSLVEISAYTETHYLKLGYNSTIQFIRFGYCRKDSDIMAIYCHK